ncbi:hypothetical protein EVAR_79115_1 [Eumeta japonica]|uniref:Uncharacterized protein n=1 Tax=Eumeta variegata TaxID=151549 RepID=A0A4C1X3M9_EUMVA|nr:hypothetical protein EVAR_79115_1 [Eumeta japonica]
MRSTSKNGEKLGVESGFKPSVEQEFKVKKNPDFSSAGPEASPQLLIMRRHSALLGASLMTLLATFNILPLDISTCKRAGESTSESRWSPPLMETQRNCRRANATQLNDAGLSEKNRIG